MMGKKETNNGVNSKLFGLRMREKMVQINDVEKVSYKEVHCKLLKILRKRVKKSG